MIFVILGTQDKPFLRLVKEIETLKRNNVIKEKLIIQAGSTKYESDQLELIDLLTMKEFSNYIKQADYIITHGGVGSILDSLKNEKKVIAVPRLKEYDEHENDHQLEIVNEFVQSGYILACNNIIELEEKIKELKQFQPKKYKGDNSKMINIIEQFIEE